MSIFERLTKLNLNDDTNVVFEYSDGDDVWHSSGDHEEKVVNSTSTIKALSAVITSTSVFATEWGTDILQEMRDDDLLSDYTHGSQDEFNDYVKNIIRENFYNYGWVSTETEMYDHKRGFTTVTAKLQAPYGEIRKLHDQIDQVFMGWTAVVRTSSGTLTIEQS
jgi:hypothetical protein